ncbi:hypothetical protein RHAL1_00149 [Beijerinckiaceae bacterium RH AL1]|nr:DUF6134 family protein [Beijerinckiaceae bacterium]VVB42359.1 hypothetical protein RHAL8_00147 [Beijerinckiaceae bacterium RH AL8]VVB42360.1 hypothetical protein RHCH11_RHCH11_00147 [Beijerinckiaceae bacterium RH CH11]VVC53269.1 hypothetical protein RHAL1_00149 [Beijerinckiaceae bacterium RH AL1]
MNVRLAGLSLAALLVSPAFAGSVAPQKHVHRVFDIMREGSKIGTDTFDISRQGDATSVKVNTHIIVKVAFITAYRYDHSEAGTWKGTQLVSFKSKTDDNGKDHTIAATQSEGKIALDVDGTSTTAPKSTQPASLWGAEVSKQKQIFDPANGKRMAVGVQDLGDETVEVNGVPRQLNHVKLTGAFPRDLWFDEDGLVKMELRGSDNSQITSQLRVSTASN